MPNPPAKSGGKKPLGIATHWWVIGGVAVVGVVYFSYHRASKNAAAQVAATTAPATDPSIDPATGIPYAQEYTGDSYGGYGAYGGGSFGGSSAYTPTDTTPVATVPATNSSWMGSAEQALASAGYSQTAITAALGGYLLGIPLPPDQLSIVEAATAQIGPPPNPPLLSLLPAQGQPQPGSSLPTPLTTTPGNTTTAAPTTSGFDALTPAQNNDTHYLTSPTLAAQRIAQEYTNRGVAVPSASVLTAMAKSAVQSGSFTASRTLIDAKAGISHV